MDVNAYFHRLGLEMPEKIVPDSALLRKLHLAHCTAVPYENLDILRDIPTSLEADALFRKIVTEGRGGLCFELNGSFGNLLRCLGYGVTDYAARYLRGEPTPPMRRHRVMRVQATDGVWLCDVGIGETAQREPIRLVEGLVQEQFGESYRLEKEDFLGWVLWDLAQVLFLHGGTPAGGRFCSPELLLRKASGIPVQQAGDVRSEDPGRPPNPGREPV